MIYCIWWESFTEKEIDESFMIYQTTYLPTDPFAILFCYQIFLLSVVDVARLILRIA